jgi:hypothetical protein
MILAIFPATLLLPMARCAKRESGTEKMSAVQGVYMDFLEKRAGKWVVVRSAGKIVPDEPRSR